MLYEEHGRMKREDQFFNLHTGIDVHIVQRFVPYVQMRLLA